MSCDVRTVATLHGAGVVEVTRTQPRNREREVWRFALRFPYTLQVDLVRYARQQRPRVADAWRSDHEWHWSDGAPIDVPLPPAIAIAALGTFAEALHVKWGSERIPPMTAARARKLLRG